MLKERNDIIMRDMLKNAASKVSEEKETCKALVARLEEQSTRLAGYEKMYKAETVEFPALARDIVRGQVREKHHTPKPGRRTRRQAEVPGESSRRWEDQPGAGEYLWPTLKDQVNEMTVEIMLNRCTIKRSMGEYEEMRQKLHEVLGLARDLDYKPLMARCAFHVACYHFGVGNYRIAARRFEEARGTEGHYREADEIIRWMIKVENKLREVDEEGEAGGGGSGDKSVVKDEFGGERLSDAVVSKN